MESLLIEASFLLFRGIIKKSVINYMLFRLDQKKFQENFDFIRIEKKVSNVIFGQLTDFL